MLEKTPGYTELEDAQDELRMNYLAKRERILEYNRELYSDYKNLEL
jgi:hypothetical protein